MTEGLIIKGNGGIYTVRTEEGDIECSLRGKFRIGEIVPTAGDLCLVENTETGKGIVKEILPRKNSLIRPKLANVDNMMIIFAAANPEPILSVVDKLTVISEKNKIKPIIIITKADVGEEEKIDEYRTIYESAGYRVIVTSKDEDDGIQQLLKDEFKNKITTVAGCSGVGKSTLLNKLFGGENLQTGEISSKSHRGKHTTTCVELFERCGGYIADTPGFSSIEINELEKEELENLFPEIKRNLGDCRFKGCSHINEPDCSVKEAFAKGDITPHRYENYVQFYTMLKSIKKY
ncbi:MAG: ribosome small subunit-dependent GTPase A [Bacillota bacterium]|nr:ribosome small subunit-dependent GTPase A [Bacillota bacterium]